MKRHKLTVSNIHLDKKDRFMGVFTNVVCFKEITLTTRWHATRAQIVEHSMSLAIFWTYKFVDYRERVSRCNFILHQFHRTYCKIHGEINKMTRSCNLILHRWGGCIVAITTKNKVSQFVDKMKKEIGRCEIKDEFKLGDLVFPTEPNQGAAIYTT